MANYLAGLYEQRGGDDKLQERYAQLVQWASEDGVLDQARKKSIPERLGGAFARLTEFFQREEFAVAGVWDVLGGTADEGETVGGRVVREMLGGTKLGNLVGVPDVRAQEAFADVMEQRGIGEGGRLSDLIGDNWVTKYFDPTVRGTAGLGMSILFTPSTYVTFGAGGAAKWVGRGGNVIRASDEAIKLGETVYKSKIDRVAKRLGLTDEIAEVAAGNKNWYDLESTVISRMTRQSNHRGLNAYNEMLMRERVRRSAEETVVRMARTRPELTENVAMRFAGVKVADLEPLGRYGSVVWDSLRNKRITAPLIGGIDEAARGLDKLFQRVPFGARKHEAFRRAEARRHAMRQSASQQANELIFGRSGFMSKKASKALFADEDANKALARFLDTGVDPPTRPAALADGASAEEAAAFQKAMADYELASEGFEAARNQWVENAARIGIDEDEALGLAGGWADLADGLGISAVSDQLIGEDAYLRFKRRYLPRNLKEEYSNRVGKEARFSFNGGDVGQYALMREYDTLDEFVERVRVLGLDPDEAVEWNVQKLMHDYVTRHIRATADANLARETVSLLSPSFNTVFKELSKDLVAFKAEPSGKELELVNDLLSRNEFINGRRLTDKAVREEAVRLTEKMPLQQAMRFLDERLSGLLDEFDGVEVERFRREVEFDLTKAQRNARREEIGKLLQERSQTLANMKEVRKLRNSLRAGIKSMEASEIRALGIPRILGEVKEMRKVAKKLRARADAKDIKVSALSEQISRNLHVLDRLQGELEAALRAPKGNLSKAVASLDELEEMRVAINEDIGFWRDAKLVAQNDVDDALDVLREAKDSSKRMRSEIAATRKQMRELKPLAKMQIVHPRHVAEIDAAKIAAMRPELRAAYLYEALSHAKSLSDVDHFFSVHDKIIGNIPHNVMIDLRRASGSRQVAGLREHTFKSGPLRGQRAMVPEGIKEFFDSDVKGMQSRLPEEAGKLLKMFDFMQNTFKRTHTALFPSFHIRNAISNTVAMSVETNIMELAAPDVTQNVIKLLTNYGDDFTMIASNGRRYTRQELRNLLVSLDVIPERMQVEELTGNSDELLKRIKGLRKIDEAAGAVGSGIENYARASYFIGQLKRGVHPMDAAMNVKRVLFDYSDLSFTQREIVRRLFPFATWTMKNVELQVKNLLTRPGRTGAVIRVANAGEMGPEADLLPEYMRGEMKVKLADQPGKAGTFITGIDLPVNNIDILWSGGVGKTMREQFGMFTPIIKAPLEYMLNLDTFTGQPIRGRRWLGQMGPVIERTWPKTMRDWIELQKIETADGRTLYKANGTKMWLISKNIFLGRMFNESVNAVGMAEEIANGDVDQGMKSLMRVLSGMRFTEMDLSDAQKEKLRREVRAIEEYLVERGGLAEYRSAFRPKYMQQQQQSGILGGLYGQQR